LKPLVDTQVEMWRYTAIKREPYFGLRPSDWFLDGDHIIVAILGSWTFGVVMDFNGSKANPKVFAVCTSLNKHQCNLKDCYSGCLERFWVDASQGGVLGKKDLLRIIANPGSLTLFDPENEARNLRLACEFLEMIENLEARRNIGQC